MSDKLLNLENGALVIDKQVGVLYNESCLITTRYTIPEYTVDLVVTSPPYDDLRGYSGDVPFDLPTVQLLAKQLYEIMKSGGVVVWIVADQTIAGSETLSSFKQAILFCEAGFNLHDTMIWSKPGFSAAGDTFVRYPNTFEYMFVFSKGQPKTFNPIKDRLTVRPGRKLAGTKRNRDGSMKPIDSMGQPVPEYGMRYNVWEINPVVSSDERTGHPAQFPEALAADHIRTWSNPGELVYDPFMGSGTTAVAAMKQGRQWIGSEVDADYCRMAMDRIENNRQLF